MKIADDIVTQTMDVLVLASLASVMVAIAVLVLVQVCIVRRAIRRGFLGFCVAVAGPCAAAEAACSGLSLQVLERLPCYGFKVGDDVHDTTECAVCLESFEVSDICRLLPACKHAFHARCVDSWLMQSPNCPTCRASADPRDGWEGGREAAISAGGCLGWRMCEGSCDIKFDLRESGASTSDGWTSSISF